ncbi:hypothetical protein PAESOLCIP111_05047 [Paenibacillus solanacearum]|uniref:Secreted protein n=1 Tax=Paenibacillus solanacearum TaxID=2048548 RepID=A0A916K8P2_9BACL|nr:hypothetical protein [Paenibacillus solanacearum]CAG7645913.1 hypothetical protein PAESOLCIP111_05047 [Paenibacillus solanacearum]
MTASTVFWKSPQTVFAALVTLRMMMSPLSAADCGAEISGGAAAAFGPAGRTCFLHKGVLGKGQ